jgi:DNA-binding response OmpR family regulator
MPTLSPDKDVRLSHATEGLALRSDYCVLVVDRSEETREVLAACLQRRGIHTCSADGCEEAMELAGIHAPDLVILDLDLLDTASAAARQALAGIVDSLPVIGLGSVRQRRKPLPGGEFVLKPYHYGPLIRKIEELLEREAGRRYARCA